MSSHRVFLYIIIQFVAGTNPRRQFYLEFIYATENCEFYGGEGRAKSSMEIRRNEARADTDEGYVI